MIKTPLGKLWLKLRDSSPKAYLQSDTVRSEKEKRKKLLDMEQWMGRMGLPDDLRRKIRRHERCIMETTRGFDEENLLCRLQEDIRRDVKRYLCYAYILRVPVFENMDERLVDEMCDRVKTVVYTEDSFIFREGDPVNMMLFITRGVLVSKTKNRGRTEYGNCLLKAGDFCGEELLTPALFTQSFSNLPASTRTVQTLTVVEAFTLTADDLKFIGSQFRQLQGKQLGHIFRFYSHTWRRWAVCVIQAAWRRYYRKQLWVSPSKHGNRLQQQVLDRTSIANLPANLLPRHSGRRKLPGMRQKPYEPDFDFLDEDH